MLYQGEQGERALQQLLLLMTKKVIPKFMKIPLDTIEAPMKLASLVSLNEVSV
ncbi:hypothetical protein KHA80_19670 [Anaerobacillus sp. HL2]|nr:hypothetical protein KHA80_19670 [Anaerobacillus sp. HL2]